MRNERLKNSQGITLVELLSSLSLVGVIGILTYSILFNGIQTHERIMEETKLRDEADYIMANFIHDFYHIKKSEIVDFFVDSNKNNYYFKICKQKSVGSCDHVDIGIKNAKIYSSNGELTPLSPDVELANDSKIVLHDENKDEYEINLVMKSKTTNQKLELKSYLTIFEEEEAENEDHP
jgi:Tfp pilus assembly protein PilE